MEEKRLTISVETLTTERDQLKDSLKEIEVEQRKLETQLKLLRQKEIRAKRQVEALNTLLEINEETTEA